MFYFFTIYVVNAMDIEQKLLIKNNFIDGKSLCCFCLAEQIPVVRLATCKHNEILQYFLKVDISTRTICLLCHTMLLKFDDFKNQIIKNDFIWRTQIINQTKSKLYNLNKSETITLTVTEAGFTDENMKDKIPPFEFITDLKIEPVSDNSEFENDLPLSEVKKGRESEVKKRESEVKEREPEVKKSRGLKTTKIYTNTVKSTKPGVDENYDGKIMIYNLSQEELEVERERESLKTSYLKLPYKCQSCIKGFDHESTLNGHNLKHHNKEKKDGVTCSVCKTILGPTSIKSHEKRHYRRFHCMECGKRSQDIHSLALHYNQRHIEREPIPMEFKCNMCDFATDSNRIYRYHRDKHRKKQQCNICGKTYVSVASLRVHMLHAHNESPLAYKCVECNKSYNSKSGFHNHNASVHGSGQGAYCVQCKTHFATNMNLANHLRTHSAHLTDDKKKFICNDCGAKFLTKANLQVHIDWEHLKSIKNECNKCSKVFKSASTLKAHNSYVHEKKRPPRNKVCDFCGRAFTTNAILVCHIRTHTGARPLRCSHCPATFAHTAALYTHNKLLHTKKK